MKIIFRLNEGTNNHPMKIMCAAQPDSSMQANSDKLCSEVSDQVPLSKIPRFPSFLTQIPFAPSFLKYSANFELLMFAYKIHVKCEKKLY
jgi:hypothetical protein